MRNQRVSSEQREELVRAFEHSGLTAAAFARGHGIKYTTLRYWLQRASQPKLDPQPTLIEVVQEAPNDGSLEIRLGEACRIEITDPKQAKLAAAVIREWEAARC